MAGREAEPKLYVECNDIDLFLSKMEQFQEEYNNDPTFTQLKGEMNLVLFIDCCEHIARISRVLSQP